MQLMRVHAMLVCFAIARLKAPPRWVLQRRHLSPPSQKGHPHGINAIDGVTHSTQRAMNGVLQCVSRLTEKSVWNAALNATKLCATERRIAIAQDECHFNYSSKQSLYVFEVRTEFIFYLLSTHNSYSFIVIIRILFYNIISYNSTSYIEHLLRCNKCPTLCS